MTTAPATTETAETSGFEVKVTPDMIAKVTSDVIALEKTARQSKLPPTAT